MLIVSGTLGAVPIILKKHLDILGLEQFTPEQQKPYKDIDCDSQNLG